MNIDFSRYLALGLGSYQARASVGSLGYDWPMTEYVGGRMAHVVNAAGDNTVCGAFPKYYGRQYVASRKVSEAEAAKRHFCKSCQKKGYSPPSA